MRGGPFAELRDSDTVAAMSKPPSSSASGTAKSERNLPPRSGRPAEPPRGIGRGWRLGLVLTVAACLVVALGARALLSRDRPWRAAERAGARWNVLLVSLDTVRPDRLEAMGGRGVPTPNLDRVRGGGFVLEQMVTPAPITLPAHTSLMTGRDPDRHGVRENTEYALPAGAATLAGLFRENGYETAAFVSAFVLDRRFGLATGFDSYEDRLDGPEPGLRPGLPELPGILVVDRAARWLAERRVRLQSRADQPPFLLFVHLFDAHAPYRPPAPFDQSFAKDPYGGELAYLDLAVGRLLDALEKNGEAEHTLVWIVSDHGESLGEHGEASHSLFAYDATLRVVSLLRPPRGESLKAARPRLVVRDPTGLIDVAPTLIDLVGLRGSLPDLDGKSVVPLLEGRRDPERRLYFETLSPLVSYHWAPLQGLRTTTWKYVRAPIPEFYDLQADPHEQENLAAARTAERDAAESELASFLARSTGAAAAHEASDPSLASDPANAARRTGSAEERERLRSLGYLSGTAGLDSGLDAMSLPDPKRMVAFFNGQFQQAKNLLYAGRYEEAATAFRTALQVDPLNNSMHLYLAGALRQAGRRDEAVASYRRALAIEPRSPRAWFGMGQAWMEAGRPDSAAQAFRASLDLLPSAPEAWLGLGECEGRAGRYASAAAALDSALARGADPVRTNGLLARLYLDHLASPSDAMRHLERFAALKGISASEARARLPVIEATTPGAHGETPAPDPRP